MTRTKSKASKRSSKPEEKKSRTAKAEKQAADTSGSSSSSTAPSATSLIDKAHTLLAQSNFELAIQFLQRALEVDGDNTEARELLGVAELEGGDAEVGREHLLHLFPPHTTSPPPHPSPYLYLAQCAQSAEEALGYYSTAVAMLEKELAGTSSTKAKGKSRAVTNEELGGDDEEEEEEERGMAVTALVAMIEIWMSDLCFDPSAETNCEALIAKAISLSPHNPEVQVTLASIRMSQQKFEEAKAVILEMYNDMEGKEPFDPSLPALPARLTLVRLLLEHALHLQALDVLATVREEDSLNVEGAYLEGWAFHLRAEALLEGSAVISNTQPAHAAQNGEETGEDGENFELERLSPDECFSEAMGSLIEAARLFTEQDYPDEGIGAHVKELLDGLEKRGVKPAVHVEGEGEGEGEEGGEWEDVEEGGDEDGDVEMA